MKRRHLQSLTAAALTVDTVDVDARLVSGVLVPYGEVGYTDAGPVIVPGPGRIELPADPGTVKLVDEHQTPPRSVGYGVAFRDTDKGLRGQFRVATTAAGDTLLAEMSPDDHGGRARDGFSVELHHIDLVDEGHPEALTLLAGGLMRVAAVATPAWSSARVDGLAASRTTTTTTERHTMTLTPEQQARLDELRDVEARTTEQEAEYRALCTLAGVDPDGGEQDPEDEQEQDAEQEQAQLSAGRQPRRRVVRAPDTGTTRRRGGRTLRDLAAAQARVLSGQSRPELEAALSDITTTANIWTARDDYAGELWGGVEYQRRYVPLMLTEPLTSYKGTGWKWTTKPEVADYAGDKAAVPSNAPVTVATSWQAARLAGAHDIDRKHFDFGDTDFIESYYRQMRESYAIKSDAKARAFLIANATAAGAAGTTLYHAAAKAAQSVFDATGGLTVDYLLVSSTDLLGLLNIAQADLPDPRILEMFGVSPDKFMPTTGVAAGTVVAGVRQAAKFRELGGSPIRVEALNIANGGVDGGVFGYYATEETFDGGIASATFAAV